MKLMEGFTLIWLVWCSCSFSWAINFGSQISVVFSIVSLSFTGYGTYLMVKKWQASIFPNEVRRSE